MNIFSVKFCNFFCKLHVLALLCRFCLSTQFTVSVDNLWIKRITLFLCLFYAVLSVNKKLSTPVNCFILIYIIFYVILCKLLYYNSAVNRYISPRDKSRFIRCQIQSHICNILGFSYFSYRSFLFESVYILIIKMRVHIRVYNSR